jgi:hypothetical protein
VKGDYAFICSLKLLNNHLFLRCSTLNFLIKFKHMVTLTNELQAMLSFFNENKFKTITFFNLIEKSDVLHLRNKFNPYLVGLK